MLFKNFYWLLRRNYYIAELQWFTFRYCQTSFTTIKFGQKLQLYYSIFRSTKLPFPLLEGGKGAILELWGLYNEVAAKESSNQKAEKEQLGRIHKTNNIGVQTNNQTMIVFSSGIYDFFYQKNVNFFAAIKFYGRLIYFERTEFTIFVN